MTMTTIDVATVASLTHPEAMRLLATELDRTLAALRALDEADWARQTDCPAWDVRAMYQHVLGACEAGASMRENVHQLRLGRAHRKAHGGPLEAGLSNVQVRERADLTGAQIVERLTTVAPKCVRGRSRTPGVVRNHATLAIDGPVHEKWKLGYLIDTIYLRDLWMHRVDAAHATERTLELTAEHDGRIVADVVAEWARRHGQPLRPRTRRPRRRHLRARTRRPGRRAPEPGRGRVLPHSRRPYTPRTACSPPSFPSETFPQIRNHFKEHITMVTTYKAAPDIDVLTSNVAIPGLGLVPINAFVLHGSEPVLVDTGTIIERDDFLDSLRSVIDPADLKWIWLTHTDFDHIGNLHRLLAENPQIRVITTFLGVGIMGLSDPLPMDRVYLVNPDQKLAVGDRTLTAIKPPVFDNPSTTGFHDDKSGAFFSSDCFGAVLQAVPENATELSDDDLREGQVRWATVDSPWLHKVDRAAFREGTRRHRGDRADDDPEQSPARRAGRHDEANARIARGRPDRAPVRRTRSSCARTDVGADDGPRIVVRR